MAGINAYKGVLAIARRGGFAGACTRAELAELLALSKADLLEIGLRLAAIDAGACDNPRSGIERLYEERDALTAAGVLQPRSPRPPRGGAS